MFTPPNGRGGSLRPFCRVRTCRPAGEKPPEEGGGTHEKCYCLLSVYAGDLAGKTQGQRMKPKCVLVVDDEAMVRDAVRRMLTRVGFEVLDANDGREAIGKVQERPVDAVLTDVVMAGMNGLELILHLQTDFPDIKVLAMTGYSGKRPEVALAIGESNILTKPFLIRDLLAVLENNGLWTGPPSGAVN